MLLVDGQPLIKHIIDIYQKYGHNEFILPLGYKGDAIKQYFIDYEWRNCDMRKSIGDGVIEFFHCNENRDERFTVTLIDTGIETMTGARIKMVERYVNDDTFMVTYGDGLSDINLDDLLAFHRSKGKIATVTGVVKKSQYGTLRVIDGTATAFDEKQSNIGIINGGFFVFDARIFDYLTKDTSCVLEEAPMQRLVARGELSVYTHNGMWISVDTNKDLMIANDLWRRYK